VIFGVCERTFPAFASDPCVGIYGSSFVYWLSVWVLLSVLLCMGGCVCLSRSSIEGEGKALTDCGVYVVWGFELPFTPFHYPLAYALYRLYKRLSLPGLIVGSMFPDLEVIAIMLLFGTQVPDRLILHSLLGVATVGTMLSVLLVVFVYPPLISGFFKIDEEKVRGKCRLAFGLVISCFLGNLSHVLLDVINHPYNPIFWPFLQPSTTPSPICSLLGGMETASLILHTSLLIAFVAISISQRQNFLERLLVGE